MLDTIAARDAHADISARAASGLGQEALLERAMRAVARVVPYDAGGWSVTDPATMLWTGGVLTGMAPDAGTLFFENELLEPDVNKFADIVRRPRHVALLSEATAGDLSRSARFRSMLAANGMGSELRVAFTAGGACWGTGCLMRAAGEPDFTADELTFVEAIGAEVARGLRQSYALAQPAGDPRAPGVLVVADDLGLVSITGEAEAWLHAVAPGAAHGAAPLPSVICSVVRRARACMLGGGADGPPSARMRMPDGRFLHVHASALGPHWAVVVEPARRPVVLPLVVEAHGLTPREREVLGLLLRGKADKEIWAALVVSTHTAREHVRKVLGKFDVRTRAELAALMFDEHYDPWLTSF